MKKISFIVVVAILLFSCKTITVNNKLQQTTKQVVELGVIGSTKKGLLNNNFIATTVPLYKQKIRVHANTTTFTKTTFKAYANATKQQNKTLKATYIDSVEVKPTYTTLQIVDKVAILKQLNANYNKEVSQYLQNTTNNSLVTELSVYFSTLEKNSIAQADEIYLINKKAQKYNLQLVKNGNVFMTLNIAKAIPFAYKTRTFCFKKEYGKITIVNLVSANESCTNDSYRNVKRLHKKENLFKY